MSSPAALVELYARFCSSLNFAAWFALRRRPLAHLIAPPLPPPDLAAASGLGAWFARAAKVRAGFDARGRATGAPRMG